MPKLVQTIIDANNKIAQNDPIVKTKSMQDQEDYADKSKNSSEDSSGDDSVQHSLPNEQDIDRLDIYDQRTYTNFGWAVVNNVLSPTEYKSFNQQLGEAVNQGKWYPKTPNGEYMFWVNDRGQQSNKVVFASGSLLNPIISKVVEVDRHKVDDVGTYVEGVIKYEGTGFDFIRFSESVARQTIFSQRRCEDFPSYRELQRTQQDGRSMQDSNANREGQQQRRGGGAPSDGRGCSPIGTRKGESLIIPNGAKNVTPVTFS